MLWFLYLLVETQEDNDKGIDKELISKLITTNNELAHLILLSNNLLNENQTEIIKNEAKSWILLYELFSNNFITEEEFTRRLNIDKNLDMYRHLKNRNIHFIKYYDKNRIRSGGSQG